MDPETLQNINYVIQASVFSFGLGGGLMGMASGIRSLFNTKRYKRLLEEAQGIYSYRTKEVLSIAYKNLEKVLGANKLDISKKTRKKAQNLKNKIDRDYITPIKNEIEENVMKEFGVNKSDLEAVNSKEFIGGSADFNRGVYYANLIRQIKLEDLSETYKKLNKPEDYLR
jgi:hypothetical protein